MSWEPLSPLVQELTELIEGAKADGEDELVASLEAQRERMLEQSSPPAQVLRELGRDRFNLDMQIAGVSAGIERLQARKRALKRTRDEIRDIALIYMERSGLQVVDTEDPELGAAKLTPNGGKDPVWVDPDIEPSALPPRYVRSNPSVDLDALREDLKAGRSFPWARLEERGKHVRWS